MKKYYKKVLLVLLVISIVIFLKLLRIENYINLENFKENRDDLLTFVRNNYWTSVLTYIFLYIFAAATALPVVALLSLIGGFLFGVLLSVIYTNIGATLGAVFTLLIFRYLLRDIVQKKFHNKLIKFNENIRSYGTNYLLLSRFIPVIPFFLVNMLAAITNIPLSTFSWTTSLGIIPGSIVYAYAGSQIININSIKDIFSQKVILAFLLLIAVALIPLFLKRYKGNNKMEFGSR